MSSSKIMLPKEAVCLLLLLFLSLTTADTRFHIKKDNNNNENNQNRQSAAAARHEAGFDPNVLNRFLEEYANKMKRTTERSHVHSYDDKFEQTGQDLETMPGDTNERNNTESDNFRDDADKLLLQMLNDTIKRHKFYSANSQEDRNTGWVTLDAIPWSKSKISKWQANPTTQGPFPSEYKPSYSKPWNSDFPSRPASYESSKPWQNKKPHWSDNSQASSNKPWYADRPRPGQDRPTYSGVDKYEENPNQAQKWPPERPSWDRFSESSRPSDIITDNGPPNFPNNNWDRPGQRPSYTHHTESYVSEHGGWNDRNDFPSNNKYNRPGNDDGYYDRPHFSHYKYPMNNDHPSNHPSSGDGQWVLLSTNRGYSKSRQRSIKLESLVSANTSGSKKKKLGALDNAGEEEENVPAVTSKRQVRLTVLPSINGTNTTTSHGGLLEVERTFKTVDQSQKEYEMEKAGNKPITNRKPFGQTANIFINKRPIRNTIANVQPSNSAVLAAVGAGMLPATMAMMIPMMLGRKKRSIIVDDQGNKVAYVRVPQQIFETKQI